ncbi:transposase [Sphingomonadaceae bacterium jetA1]
MKRGSLKRSEAGETRVAAPAQIMVPMFGYKNHAGIERTFGFIRKWAVTHAARHDSGAFEDVLDTGNIAQSVWADTAYRSAKNEAAIRRARLKSMIHFRKPRGKPMDRRHQRANAARSKVRSAVEHVFAVQKSRMALSVGPVRPHHRHRAREDENRHGQPGLQLQTARLARRENCVRLTPKRRRKSGENRKISRNQPTGRRHRVCYLHRSPIMPKSCGSSRCPYASLLYKSEALRGGSVCLDRLAARIVDCRLWITPL